MYRTERSCTKRSNDQISAKNSSVLDQKSFRERILSLVTFLRGASSLEFKELFTSARKLFAHAFSALKRVGEPFHRAWLLLPSNFCVF
jgi:hypothetical protein